MTEATSNLIDNKIADKITSTSKDSSKNALKTDENGLAKNKYLPPEKMQQIIEELRLVSYK